MKYLIVILPLIIGISAFAQNKKTTRKATQKAPVIKEAGKYGTNHAFDGAALNGRLNEGSLRKIVVENDKSLEDLLGVRKKFDDREIEEKQRNASW